MDIKSNEGAPKDKRCFNVQPPIEWNVIIITELMCYKKRQYYTAH